MTDNGESAAGVGNGGARRIEQIIDLAAEGRTDKEIALALGISSHTVSTHWKRLRVATGAKNRTAAVLLSLRERIEQQNQELRAANEALQRVHEKSRDSMTDLLLHTQRRLAETHASANQQEYFERASRLCRFVVYELRSLSPVVYSFLSRSMEEFGHNQHGMMNATTTFYDMVHPEDLPLLIEKSLGATYAPEEAYVFTYRLRTPEPRWVLDRHQAVYDSDGRMTGVLGVAFDIHELTEQGIIKAEVTRTVLASPPV